jgi:hypothetical protein
MSPEMRKKFNSSQMNAEEALYFYQKSDVFSFGLVLLALILSPKDDEFF